MSAFGGKADMIAITRRHEASPIADKKSRAALRRDPASRAPFEARRALTRAAWLCQTTPQDRRTGSGGRRSAHHDHRPANATAARGNPLLVLDRREPRQRDQVYQT